MWSLHGSGERNFVWGGGGGGVLGHMTKMALLKSFPPEPKGQWPWGLVCSIGDMGPTKFVQMMTLGWPWPFLWQGWICFLVLLYGKYTFLQEKCYKVTYNKWPEWQKVYFDIKCWPPVTGLCTCIKTWKNIYKIRLQRDFFETCNKWAKW